MERCPQIFLVLLTPPHTAQGTLRSDCLIMDLMLCFEKKPRDIFNLLAFNEPLLKSSSLVFLKSMQCSLNINILYYMHTKHKETVNLFLAVSSSWATQSQAAKPTKIILCSI